MAASRLGLVCVGGGSGTRFGSDKLRQSIAGTIVFALSIRRLREAFPESPMVAVVPSSALDEWADLLKHESCDGVIAGGDRRQDSVRFGVEWIADQGADQALIHDAARPLIHSLDIRAVAAALECCSGAILCRPATDTVKRVDLRGRIAETISRSELRLAQTPQVFRVADLRRAWAEHDEELEWTDEAAMLEALGLSVVTVVAQHPNPKITTPVDLVVARALTGCDS